MARQQLSLSVVIGDALYERHAPTMLAQLERDSGLAAYRACADSMPANARLHTALSEAVARYEATPARERVYRVDEAIKFVARFATVSIVIGVRGRDSRLLASLPGMLEPFAGFSPILHALWQNLISATEMNYAAQPLQARARAIAVYEGLGKCQGEDLRYVETIRYAVCYALGVIEVSLGYASASDWIAQLDSDRMQQVNAMRLRSFQSLYEGDAAEAERYRTAGEILALQASARQMFDSPLVVELAAQMHASDLVGVKRVADRIAGRAAKETRWRAAAYLANGLYQHLRGDFAAAHEAFTQCITLDNPTHTDRPPWLDTWRMAVAGNIPALVELGRVAEACSFGEAALQQAQRLGLGPWSDDIARELALAEAKLGELDRAARRLDALIASRALVLPSYLAADYEARACVAIWAKDTTAAAHFAALAVRHDRLRRATLLVRKGRLIDEARAAGLDVAMLPTDFESAVLGASTGASRRAGSSTVRAALHMQDPAARARAGLELLCDAARATSGHLYLNRGEALQHAASLGAANEPALAAFVHAYWKQQLQEHVEDDFTTQSDSDAAESQLTSWTQAGTSYQLLLLRGSTDGTLHYTGVVALAANHADLPALYWELAAAVSARLLELGDAEGASAD
jgi:hypothetical protein